MNYSTLIRLGLLMFGLIFLAFLIRGFGQFVVGSRRAMLIAGPVAVIAGILCLVILGSALLAKLGLVALEHADAED